MVETLVSAKNRELLVEVRAGSINFIFYMDGSLEVLHDLGTYDMMWSWNIQDNIVLLCDQALTKWAPHNGFQFAVKEALKLKAERTLLGEVE